MALDIAHGYAQAAVRQGNEIEIVAAGLIGRISCCGKVEAGNNWRRPIKLLLDLSRQTQLDFALLDFQVLADILCHGDKVRNVTGFIHHGGNRFLRGIDFPVFSSIVNSSLKGPSRHQFSPQAFVEGGILQPRLQNSRSLAAHVVRTESGHRLERRIDVFDEAISVREQDAVCNLFHHL